MTLHLPLSGSNVNVPEALPLSAIIGAVTIGIGISLTILAGGSTAGPDTIGLVLKKRFQIPITLTMIVIDVLVILCGYNIYGIRTTAWSIGVAVIMNITVKLMRIIFSDEYRKKILSSSTKDTNIAGVRICRDDKLIRTLTKKFSLTK